MTTDQPKKTALFPLGRLSATAGAITALQVQMQDLVPYMHRHALGDWGCVSPEDAAANDEAVRERNGRILSAYPLDPAKPCKGYGENCLWVITEADRSVTTFLLPEEY